MLIIFTGRCLVCVFSYRFIFVDALGYKIDFNIDPVSCFLLSFLSLNFVLRFCRV